MDNTEGQCKQIVVGYPNGEHNRGEVKCLKELSQQSTANNFKEVDYPSPSGFQMPLHYPHYTKADQGMMEEWKVDLLLRQYGLSFKRTLDEKRAFAMGAFLSPDQY